MKAPLAGMHCPCISPVAVVLLLLLLFIVCVCSHEAGYCEESEKTSVS